MPQDQFRVFLSAVTGEFGKARDALGADLRSRELLLRVQSDFRQEPESDTTLKKLHDYIRDCSAVVCVIGKCSGALPPPAAAAPFSHMLPSGIAAASYTQWEFFFARHFKRRLSIYIAHDDHQPDRASASEDDAELQKAFVAYIKKLGLDRSYFSNEDQLGRAVLREDWPKKRQPKPIALPYLSLGSLFKGRDGFLTELHKSVNRGDGRTAIVGSALYGLGGIGKTRAAVEYAWAHQEDYSALLFVIAETPEALRRNLAALVGPLALNLPEQSVTEEPVRLKAVLDWLSEHPGWFLILDNVDTPEALAEAERLLSTLSGGHVIVTSRLANFAGNFDPLELDVLDLDAAAAFLLERTDRRRQKTPDDAVVARQLARDLGQLALALEQAGAYTAKLGLSFARYRQQWQDNWAKVAGWADEATMKYSRAIAVTWQTSVNQVSAPGRRLLERLAWLAPEPVPNFLIGVAVPGIAAEDTEEALADLAGYSLVRRNLQSQEFSVHRLVKDVTRRSLAGQDRPPSLVEMLDWINAAFPFDAVDVRNWPQAEALAPHALAVTEHAAAAGISAPTARLMNQVGLLLRAKALYAEAEPLYRRALAIDETSYGPDHPEVATDLNNLAELLGATNRLSEAEPLYRRALAISENSYGPEHPSTVTVRNNLAGLRPEKSK
jgi:tetratricopeptide (TPR) repeat protein